MEAVALLKGEPLSGPGFLLFAGFKPGIRNCGISGIIGDGDTDKIAGSGRSIKLQRNAGSIWQSFRAVSCYTVATEGPTQGCAVNPRYERELRLRTEEQPAREKKHVVVVGGGPAGMRAAMEASRRGYRVTLLEKDSALGGLLRISYGDPIKVDMNNYLRYLIYQVENSPIDVRLNCEATPELVRELEPDELIVAVGSEPVKPRIPGVELPHVVDILQAHEKLDAGWKNVVIIGGGPSGCELALTLADRGVSVALVEMTAELASAGNLLYRAAMEIRLKEFAGQIECLTETACMEILEDRVLVKTGTGEIKTITADGVVYCVGMRGKKALAESFYGIVYDVSMVGDCMGARRINEATHEGYFAGHRI